MNKEQYLQQRGELLNTAKAFIADGKLEDAKSKREEIEALDVAYENSSKELANLNALENKAESFKPSDANTAVNGATKIDDVTADVANIKYEDVFAKVALKRDLNEDEVNVFNQMNPTNVYTHNTDNTEILIPETVVGGIIETMKELHPILADVNSTRIKGNIKYVKHTGIPEGDADYYDEATATVDESNTFGEITLGGKELSKAVTVTWKLQAMAIADFIPFLQRELGQRMAYAKANAFVRGAGDTKYPMGIVTALKAQAETPQVAEYTDAITFDDLSALFGKVKTTYSNGIAVYVNNSTLWNQLNTIKDTNGRPIFVQNVADGIVGRLFGYPVKLEDAMRDGEVLVGDVGNGYTENIQESMRLTTEQHAKARKTDFVGYEVHDANVKDEGAFAYLAKTEVVGG